MEAVEVLPGLLHLLVTLPRLRDHHEDRVRQRIAAHVKQFKRLVKGGRVAGRRRADREDPGDVAGQDVTGQVRLAGAHPVSVALNGVDLAVVGDVAEWMREWPRRERVRRKARVHQCERRFHTRIGEIRVELGKLLGAQHPLIDERPPGEAGEVRTGFGADRAKLVLDALAHDEGTALQADAVQPVPRNEDLTKAWLHALGTLAEHGVIGRNLAPAEGAHALFGDDCLNAGDDALRGRGNGRKECDPRRVVALAREVEIHDLVQEGVGHLNQDPGAVARVDVASKRTTVFHAAERPDGRLHNPVAAQPLHVHDEVDATGVMFEPWVVEPLRSGDASVSGAFVHAGPVRREAFAGGPSPGIAWRR